MVFAKPWGLSVRVIIKDQTGRYLLLKRSKNAKTNAGKWELPGGKTDQHEHFDAALLREVAEETGLAISVEHVAGALESELPKVKVAHLLLEGRVESGQLRLSSEHDAYAWVDSAELGSMDVADWFRPFAEALSGNPRLPPKAKGVTLR